jgi:4-methyl-5(b-hydroxyethyl)-thiazole monophosphate biosynthesis
MKGMMLFADSFEDIEALGTLDLIRRAKIEIDTVSITGSKVVLTQSKVNVMADKLIEEINLDDYDFLIIPGGAAVMKTHLNSPITESIAMYFYKKHALIGCICAAPSVLGKYGMLEDKEYTCFPSFEKLVIGGTYLSDAKVVVSDNIITSKAAGTTFDFAYEIIKYLRSESIANHIREAVFYN